MNYTLHVPGQEAIEISQDQLFPSQLKLFMQKNKLLMEKTCEEIMQFIRNMDDCQNVRKTDRLELMFECFLGRSHLLLSNHTQGTYSVYYFRYGRPTASVKEIAHHLVQNLTECPRMKEPNQ